MNMNYMNMNMNMNMNMILIIIFFSYHHLLTMTIPTAFSATAPSSNPTGDGYILHKCPPNLTKVIHNTSYEYTFNSNYSHSRNALLEDLRVNTSKNKGFWVTTSAIDINNRVYGLALCRGNLSSKHCQTCLDNVTRELNSSCTNSTNAIIYRYHCFMKYSDKDFFGRISSDKRSVVYRPHRLYNSSRPSKTFKSTTKDLLDSLTTEASPKGNKTETDPLFAYGYNNTTGAAGNETVYAMVQCTKDIWLNCDACLEKATAYLGRKSPFPVGGILFYGGTCVLRYEKYPFL